MCRHTHAQNGMACIDEPLLLRSPRHTQPIKKLKKKLINSFHFVSKFFDGVAFLHNQKFCTKQMYIIFHRPLTHTAQHQKQTNHKCLQVWPVVCFLKYTAEPSSRPFRHWLNGCCIGTVWMGYAEMAEPRLATNMMFDTVLLVDHVRARRSPCRSSSHQEACIRSRIVCDRNGALIDWLTIHIRIHCIVNVRPEFPNYLNEIVCMVMCVWCVFA